MDADQVVEFVTSNPIEYLVRRRFPDWRMIEMAPISLSSIGHGGLTFDECQKRAQEIEAYRAELKSKSTEELHAVYLEEKKKEASEYQLRAERDERRRFFNQASAQADFDHWSKTTYWRLDEAIALAFGKAPEVVSWKQLSAIVGISPFAKKFAQVRDLALRAVASKQLFDPTLPGFFLAWARRMDIAVPTELIEQVEKRGIVVADWKDAYDKLKEQFDALVADRDKFVEISQRLISQRDELKGKLVEVEMLAWEGFDPDSETYPPELDIAMQVWRAVSTKRDETATAKEQIEQWLDKHYPDRRKLSNEARQRIAVVCNWEKSGGRRKRED